MKGAAAAAAALCRALAGQGTVPTVLCALSSARAGHTWEQVMMTCGKTKGFVEAALLCTHSGHLQHRTLAPKNVNQRETTGKGFILTFLTCSTEMAKMKVTK